jgi:hypothetical protein
MGKQNRYTLSEIFNLKMNDILMYYAMTQRNLKNVMIRKSRLNGETRRAPGPPDACARWLGKTRTR